MDLKPGRMEPNSLIITSLDVSQEITWQGCQEILTVLSQGDKVYGFDALTGYFEQRLNTNQKIQVANSCR